MARTSFHRTDTSARPAATSWLACRAAWPIFDLRRGSLPTGEEKAYSFCPTNASWGYDNRTVALRVIEGSAGATRIEKRDAGADCNPYLLAAEIGAGLDGIEAATEPLAETRGNAYLDQKAPRIPHLEDAIGSVWPVPPIGFAAPSVPTSTRSGCSRPSASWSSSGSRSPPSKPTGTSEPSEALVLCVPEQAIRHIVHKLPGQKSTFLWRKGMLPIIDVDDATA